MNRLGALSGLVLLSLVALSAATSCGKRLRHQPLTGGLRQWIVGGVEAVRGAYPWQVKYVRLLVDEIAKEVNIIESVCLSVIQSVNIYPCLEMPPAYIV